MTDAAADPDAWAAVAAPDTDPAVLARVVALATDGDGRAAVRAALTGQDGLLEATDAGLPTPSDHQREVAARVRTDWVELEVRVALCGDPAWPPRLRRLAAPPPLLAWRGPDRLPDRPAVAIVGARRATPYGTGVAAWLAEAAAEAGATVVSGGAVGIDAAAHGAAVGHATTVVLGCGHDVAYPRPHAEPGGLFDRVLDGGGAMVSELLPGTRPRPHNVRARNRIVAALADVVVVVEGGPRSGSLLTAGEAADAGVEVLAVPGDVRAPGSAAPHRLLREGAAPCTGPDDLQDALRMHAGGSGGHDRAARDAASGDEALDPAAGADGSDDAEATGAVVTVLPPPVRSVLAAAWPRPVPTDQLSERAGVGIGTVLAAVTRGRVHREVVETAAGVRLCRAPGPDE